MTPGIPEKWIRRMTSPLAKLAVVSTPAALTCGVPAFATPLLSKLLNGSESMPGRVVACFHLINLASVTFMTAVGFAVCVRFWNSMGKKKLELKREA
jgi:hypothetical protein